MIEYRNRYSQTHLPDELGRWARIAIYKKIRIAWISKHKNKGVEIFVVNCHFPTMQNDSANENKIFFNLDNAKEFISERWNFFLNAVS